MKYLTVVKRLKEVVQLIFSLRFCKSGVSIGYSIVFKKTVVNIYHDSRFSTLDVRKWPTICLVLLNI